VNELGSWEIDWADAGCVPRGAAAVTDPIGIVADAGAVPTTEARVTTVGGNMVALGNCDRLAAVCNLVSLAYALAALL